MKAGATSQSIYFEVLDSTSTTGGRKTGLVYNTANLVAYYVRAGGSATAITLATLAAANSAWSSGGFKEVDATNMPGVYRLDLPDAAIAAGVPSVVVVIKGATGMVQASKEIVLEAVDFQDAVRMGLTALPNAAAEAAGGLFTRGTGAGQINQPANGRIDANLKSISDDATAADNLETMLDGTGGQTLSLGALDIHGGGVALNIESDSDVAINVAGLQVMTAYGNSGGIQIQTGYGNPVKLEAVGAGYEAALALITNGPTAFSITDEVTIIDVEDTLRNTYGRVNNLSAGQVTVVSPIAVPSQAITLYQGDSYYGNKTQKLSWNIPLNIADLTGATATFKLKHASLFTKSLTVANAGVDGSQTLSLSLTSAETAAMTVGNAWKYELEVSWTSPTEVRTVVVGAAIITEQLS